MGIVIAIVGLLVLAGLVMLALKRPEAVLNLDRRVIYLIVAFLVALPIFLPLELPVIPGNTVRPIFEGIDALPEGSDVLVSGDYGPSSKAELQPMVEAVITHCFIKKHRLHIMAIWDEAPGLIQTTLEKQAGEYGRTNGTDYAFLGYKAGALAVIRGVMDDIPGTFRTDFYGKPTATMPIYRDNAAAKNFDYMIEIAAGTPGPETWIPFGTAPNKLPLGLSCTAVSAAQYSPYLQAGQITGLATGMKGTAEYEVLLREKYAAEIAAATGASDAPAGEATKGMDAQSAVHVFIVLSIILANIALGADRRRREGAIRGQRSAGGAA
jgi:hypothetical protein